MKQERSKEQSVEGVAEKLGVPKNLGVVLVILDGKSLDDGDPRIWTINELSPKPETERIPGQHSLPAETRKEDEGEISTVFGGIAEFTDSDEVLGQLRIHPDRFYVRSAFGLRGYNVDMAFAVYEGPPDSKIVPIDKSEVEPNGWMRVSDASMLNGEMRSLAHDSIKFVIENGIIERLALERDSMVPITSLVGEGFSLHEFIRQRDTQEDIVLN